MPLLLKKPVPFHDEAVHGEEIQEYVGRISTETDVVSVALLEFPGGWSEPPQRPDFDEYSVVLKGSLYVDTESVGTVIVRAGQAILTLKGERVRYRTPEPGGAKYLGVCLPAFRPDCSHREAPDAEIAMTDRPVWTPKSRVVLVRRPTYLQGTGLRTKMIEEYFGIMNSNATALSIAHIRSQEGCVEDFHEVSYDKYYIILKGELHMVTPDEQRFVLRPGEGILVEKGEVTRYGTPGPDGAEYIIVCLPARDLDFDCRELRTEIDKINIGD